MGVSTVNKFYIFIIRVSLGSVFATIISYFFFQRVTITSILVMSMIIIGLAYFAEFLRNRKID